MNIKFLCHQATIAHSAYLSRFVEKEHSFLRQHYDNDWEHLLLSIIDDIKNLPISINGLDSFKKNMRCCKYRAQCLLGLAEISHNVNHEHIWRYHSLLADMLVDKALSYMVAYMHHDGVIDSIKQHGFFIIALGKWGGDELNFSSDIDGIIFVDTNFIIAEKLSRFFDKANFYGRLFLNILSDYTIDGYVLRTDLRLRPDPATTSLIINVDMAVNYYQSQGETWERAALTKMRFCAGNQVLAKKFINEVQPFIYRKYLDYEALEQIRAVRWRIIKETEKKKRDGIHVKTDKGGIRAIEFIVQALLLVWGGKYNNLRHYNSLHNLKLLHNYNIINAADYRILHQSYIMLRHVEHALQMLDDQQTQFFPNNADIINKVSGLIGYDGDDLYGSMQAMMTDIWHIETRILPYDAPDTYRAMFYDISYNKQASDILNAMNVHDKDTIYAIFHHWFTGQHKAFKRDKSLVLLEEFFMLLCAIIVKQKFNNIDDRIVFIDGLLATCSYPSQLLYLFKYQTFILHWLLDIIGLSPYMSDQLIAAPYLLENLTIEGQGAMYDATNFWPDIYPVIDDDNEGFLLDIRKTHHDIHFNITATYIKDGGDVTIIQNYYTQLAIRTLEAAIAYSYKVLNVPDDALQFAIIGFGSVANNSLCCDSDLDFILVYNGDETQEHCNNYGMVFYNKFVTRIISFMESRMKYGFLYNCDMRLRPSGADGPLAVSLKRYQQYHMGDESWAWEKLAIARSSIIYSSDATILDILRHQQHAILQHAITKHDYAIALGDMRHKIHHQHGQKVNLKTCPGGIMDSHFLLEYCTIQLSQYHDNILDVPLLERLDAAVQHNILDHDDAMMLSNIVQYYNIIIFIAKITHGQQVLLDDEEGIIIDMLYHNLHNLPCDLRDIYDTLPLYYQAINAIYNKYFNFSY